MYFMTRCLLIIESSEHLELQRHMIHARRFMVLMKLGKSCNDADGFMNWANYFVYLYQQRSRNKYVQWQSMRW